MNKVNYSNEKFNKKDIWAYVGVTLLAFVFSLQSYSNCFVYREQGVDSAVFQYVAKAMINGYMPYRDTFDHKGPLLYAINILGLIINEKWGIWLVELAFLIISFVFMYRAFRLWSGRAASILVLAISFAPFGHYFYGGNYCEEYSIPFIAISLYIFLDYFKNAKITNLRLFICGFSFAAVLLLRPNNAVLWAFMCFCVMIDLIIKKDITPVFHYIFWFFVGLVSLILPFIIWLLGEGIFSDFIFCYVKFNIMYSHADFSARLYCFVSFLLNLPVLLSVIICLYYLVKNKSVHALGYLLLILSTLYFVALSGDTYVHYGLILIPVIMCPYAVLFSDLKRKETSIYRFISYALALFSALLVLMPFSVNVYFDAVYDMTHAGEEYFPEDYAYVVGYTDYYTDEDDKVLYFGNCNRYYLLTDRLSASKYSYQSPILDVSRELGWADDFFDELDKEPPKLIGVLTPAAYICDRGRMEEFLSSHDYTLILITDDISLYVYEGNAYEA